MLHIIFILCHTFFSGDYNLGTHTIKVPMKLHQVNRERLCKELRTISDVPKGAVVVLQGGEGHQRYDTDVDVATFRQV